jgi:hypothetical protein
MCASNATTRKYDLGFFCLILPSFLQGNFYFYISSNEECYLQFMIRRDIVLQLSIIITLNDTQNNLNVSTVFIYTFSQMHT